VNVGSIEALAQFQIHLEATDARCDLPDVAESDAGKRASPDHGNRNATDGSSDYVTQVLP